MGAMRMAVEFRFLPDPVDIGLIGEGSAVGGVVDGLWAYFLGYSLEQIATHAAGAAIAFGVLAAAVWLTGLSGL